MWHLSIYLVQIEFRIIIVADMIKKAVLILYTVLMAIAGSFGQDTIVWSLEDCVRYAYENNIRVKQQDLNVQHQENTLKQSRLNQLPNFNAGASHTYSQGRSLNEATYLYTTKDQNSSNFHLSTSVSLFKGLQQRYTIKQNDYNLQASLKEVEKMKNDISVSIALAYLQILLNEELLELNGNQLELTEQQIERTTSLVNAGSLPEGNLLEIRAQKAREEIQMINSENQLLLSYLNLTQMLDMDSVGGFAIENPNLEQLIDTNYLISPVSVVFNDALLVMPEINSAELRLKSSEQDLKIAKGARLPSLSLNGSWGARYSDAWYEFDPVAGSFSSTPSPFWDQMNNSRNWGLTFGLSIPIFNKWMINTGVNNAKLGIENRQYELRNTQNTLYKEIQQAYADAVAAQKKYRASETAVESMEEAFRYTGHKFNVGLLNSVDYNTSKNLLTQSQSELLQAKYEYVFYINVLEFYRGKAIEF